MGSNRGFGFRFASALTVAAFMSSSLPAFAQAAGLSEQLYRQGQELMKEGKTHDACAKFAASYRADNTAVGSLLATAACHEKEGKNAAAWGEYTAVASLAQRNGEADRQAYASDHAKALEPKLHHVVLATSFNVATAPEGFSVVLDGTTIDAGALNSQIPIDAGDHDLQVSAPGKTPVDKKFKTADDTNTDTVTIAELADAPKNQQTIIVKNEETTHLNKTKLALGVIFGVVGLGGVGAAVGLGLSASHASNASSDAFDKANKSGFNVDANGVCTGDGCSNYTYSKSAHDTASLDQNLAIASGIVGGLALVAGIFFIVTSPETKAAAPPPQTEKGASIKNLTVTPLFGPQMNGIGLGGSF